MTISFFKVFAKRLIWEKKNTLSELALLCLEGMLIVCLFILIIWNDGLWWAFWHLEYMQVVWFFSDDFSLLLFSFLFYNLTIFQQLCFCLHIRILKEFLTALFLYNLTILKESFGFCKIPFWVFLFRINRVMTDWPTDWLTTVGLFFHTVQI